MPFWCTLEGQYGYGRTSTSGFSPKDITGLNTWYDASDLTTMYDATTGGSLSSNGGRVARWEDKSGNSNNALQITGQADTTRPVLTFNAQNGRSALQFSTNESRQLNGGTGIYPYDVYMIIQTPISASNFDLIGVGASGSDNFNGFGLNTGNVWNQSSSLGARSYTTTPAETSSNFLLIRWTATNTTNTYQTWRNGTNIGTANFSWTFPASPIFRIGNRTPNTATTTRAWNGRIGEILIYNNQLTLIDRQLIEGYLCSKWGIQSSLPVGHPYRSNAPLGIPLTPYNTNNLALWYDAALRANLTTTTGNLVTQWTDITVGWNLSQATTANQPVYTFEGIYFDGTNDTLTRSFTQTFLDLRSNYGLFIINSLSNRAIRDLFEIRNGTNTGILWENRTESNAIRYLHRQPMGTTGGVDNWIGIPSVYSTSVCYIEKIGSTLNQYYNGSLCNTVSSNAISNFTLSFNQMYLGSLSASARYHSGLISEVLFYNTNLEETVRQQLEGYFASKWMFQSRLPSTHPYYTFPPLKPQTPFQPTMINNLTLWFDASDTNYLTLSGSTITQILDKSGNGRNTTAAFGTTVLQSNALNNLNTMKFISSYYTGLLNYPGNTITTFVVGSFDSSSDATARLMSYTRSGVSDTGGVTVTTLARNSATNIITARSTSNYTATFPALSEYFMVFANQRETYGFIGVNGENPSINVNTFTTNFSTSIYAIGQNAGSPTTSYYGNVAEVLVYLQTLSSVDRQDVEGYLAWKWGLQSLLPSTHPFKSNAP
jgi:hypothetical protein